MARQWKRKRDVDGSAKQRSIQRSSKSSCAWEQKAVSQTLDTLAVKPFIAWRMSEKEQALQFRGPSAYFTVIGAS